MAEKTNVQWSPVYQDVPARAEVSTAVPAHWPTAVVEMKQDTKKSVEKNDKQAKLPELKFEIPKASSVFTFGAARAEVPEVVKQERGPPTSTTAVSAPPAAKKKTRRERSKQAKANHAPAVDEPPPPVGGAKDEQRVAPDAGAPPKLPGGSEGDGGPPPNGDDPTGNGGSGGPKKPKAPFCHGPFKTYNPYFQGKCGYTVVEIAEAWLTTYKPTINSADLNEVLKAFQWYYDPKDPDSSVQVVNSRGAHAIHPHKTLALLREQATMYCIYSLIKEGHRVIDSLFGNKRDKHIVDKLNRELKWWGHEAIELNVMGIQVTTDDLNRREMMKQPPLGSLWKRGTAAFLMDVYAVGGTTHKPEPLTQEWVASLGYERVLWAGHLFNGPFGCLGKAAWIRKEEGISWTADYTTAPYPVHPPCDELHRPYAANGWGRFVERTYLFIDGATPYVGYNVVRFEPVTFDQELGPPVQTNCIKAQIPAPLLAIQSRIGSLLSWLGEPTVEWLEEAVLDWMPTSISHKEVFLLKHHYTHMLQWGVNKGRNKFSFRSCLREATLKIQADLKYSGLGVTHVALMGDYVFELAVVAFSAHMRSRASMTAGMLQMSGSSFRRFSQSVEQIDAPPDRTTSWTRLGVYCVGIAAATFFLRRYLPRTYAATCPSAFEKVCQAGREALNAGAQLLTAQSHSLPEYLSKAMKCLWNGPTYAISGKLEGATPLASGVAAIGHIILVAPLLEEGIKRIFPSSRYKIASSALIAAGDVAGCLLPANARLSAFLTNWCLHSVWAHLPYPVGVVAHSAYNFCVYSAALQAVDATIQAAQGDWRLVLAFGATMVALEKLIANLRVEQTLDKFDELHYGQAKSYVSPEWTDATTYVGQMRDDQFVVPSVDCQPVTTPKECVTVQVKLDGPPPEPDCDNTVFGYARAIAHNAPMYRPKPSDSNRLAVVQHRLAKEVMDYSDETVELHERSWRTAYAGVFERDWARQLEGEWDLRVASERKYEQLMFGTSEEIPFAADLTDDLRLEQLADDPYWPMSMDACDCQSPEFDLGQTFEEWLLHTESSKRQRYVMAWNRVCSCPLESESALTTKVEVNVKTDEVLLKYATSEEENGWIPRPIHNVAPEVAVTLGPAIYKLTDKLKTQLNMAKVNDDVFPITLTYGAGMTADELDQWFEDAMTKDGAHIIVAGDDSVVVVKRGDSVVFVVGDVSQCDHSLRSAALAAEWRLLYRLGLETKALELLISSSRSLCVLAGRNGKGATFTVKRECERNTGGTDTTVGNTVLVGLAWVFILKVYFFDLGNLDATVLQDGFLNFLGLKMKIVITGGRVTELGSSFWAPDFLKGTWWACTDGAWHWGPLLGRLLKLFKTTSNPVVTYRRLGVNDLRSGLECHMCAVVKSMGPFTFPLEIKRWWNQWSDVPQSSMIVSKHEDLNAFWKPQANQAYIPVPGVWQEQVAARYGVDADHVNQFCSILFTCKVGSVFFHPLWVRMAFVDYN